VCRCSVRDEGLTYLPPSSNDQIEEGNLADGLDMTSKAWEVSTIDLILDRRMGQLTGSLSGSIRGALHVLWVSTTGKYTGTGGNNPNFLTDNCVTTGGHFRGTSLSCNLCVPFQTRSDGASYEQRRLLLRDSPERTQFCSHHREVRAET